MYFIHMNLKQSEFLLNQKFFNSDVSSHTNLEIQLSNQEIDDESLKQFSFMIEKCTNLSQLMLIM
ncbi:hypothetical protein ABPG74_019158, partial [Tetrahymena malaccensis]